MLDGSFAHETNNSEMTSLEEWECGKRGFQLPLFRSPKEAVGKLPAIFVSAAPSFRMYGYGSLRGFKSRHLVCCSCSLDSPYLVV